MRALGSRERTSITQLSLLRLGAAQSPVQVRLSCRDSKRDGRQKGVLAAAGRRRARRVRRRLGRLPATHGHIPGHQSLRVRLDSGDVVLAADACYFLPNLARAAPAPLRARQRGDARLARSPGGARRGRRAHLLRPRHRILAHRAASPRPGLMNLRRPIPLVASRRTGCHLPPRKWDAPTLPSPAGGKRSGRWRLSRAALACRARRRPTRGKSRR
jgi:hypothetical protein